MKMKTWWKIRQLSFFLFPSPLFLLFSDWFLPACPCSVFISFSCGLLYILSILAIFFLVSVNLCSEDEGAAGVRWLFLWFFFPCFCFLCLLFFPVPYSRFSSLFYRDSSTAPFNQSCLCRTVIFHERDRGRETWSMIGSNPLQIFSLLNRDGEDEHGCSASNGDVSAAMDIFIFDPWSLEF